MKITNHSRKMTYYISDGSVMHGTIKMTISEYAQAIMYLQERYEQAVKEKETYVRDSLTIALSVHRDKFMNGASLFSLGVCATELIAQRYKLKNYKSQNYALLVKKI